MDCFPPGASVHGILQARIVKGVACPPPGDLPHPGIMLWSPVLAGRFFTTSASWEAPYDPEMVSLCHYMLIQTQRIRPTKSEA